MAVESTKILFLFGSNRSTMLAAVLALSQSLLPAPFLCQLGAAAADASNPGSSQPRKRVFQLQATVLDLLGKPTKDTVYRYFTEA